MSGIDLWVDPRAKVSYAGFYLAGFIEVLGAERVRFARRPFCDLSQHSQEEDFDQYFAARLEPVGGPALKLVIDYRDRSRLSRTALDWADVYGKVNLHGDELAGLETAQIRKVVPLGPGFGIRLWPWVATLAHFFRNTWRSRKQTPASFRAQVAAYHWQLRRQPLTTYSAVQSAPDYAFHVSKLYQKQAHGEKTNLMRAEFIRACRARAPRFEGGLVCSSSPVPQGYEDVAISSGVSPAQYLENVRRSAVVFSTPAAWGCLGWKLGEFLALGKAIVSTPIEHALPAPLEHGEHLLLAANPEQLKDSINRLFSDAVLRRRLERNASAYFDQWLHPAAIARRLMAMGLQGA